MKALKDHVLLYDEVCPLCRAYSGAFVKCGMLDSSGRTSYQSVEGKGLPDLDVGRAVDEIALVDRTSGKVTYGAKSLMLILAHSFPVFVPLFKQRWFNRAAEKAYRFVSYNRRVIMPARDGFSAQPSFNIGYRSLYLLFAWLVTASFLHHYSALIVPLIPPTNYGREFFICGGQIIWQWIFLAALGQHGKWDYLGNMMTISLAGGIALGGIQLLLPDSLGPYVFGALFTAVAGLMFLEHIRRTRILGINSWLTVSWILYRVVLLAVILWL